MALIKDNGKRQNPEKIDERLPLDEFITKGRELFYGNRIEVPVSVSGVFPYFTEAIRGVTKLLYYPEMIDIGKFAGKETYTSICKTAEELTKKYEMSENMMDTPDIAIYGSNGEQNFKFVFSVPGKFAINIRRMESRNVIVANVDIYDKNRVLTPDMPGVKNLSKDLQDSYCSEFMTNFLRCNRDKWQLAISPVLAYRIYEDLTAINNGKLNIVKDAIGIENKAGDVVIPFYTVKDFINDLEKSSETNGSQYRALQSLLPRVDTDERDIDGYRSEEFGEGDSEPGIKIKEIEKEEDDLDEEFNEDAVAVKRNELGIPEDYGAEYQYDYYEPDL